MKTMSVIKNPARLSALLREKINYNRYMSPNHSFLNYTLEDEARCRRVDLFRTRIESQEKQQVLLFIKFIENGEITIEDAAKYSGMTIEKFRKRLQEIMSEKECAETHDDTSDYKPLSDSELKSMMMRYIKRGYSIPTIAGYTYRTVERIEEITGLKSEVSQLEYDIINDILEYRTDLKKEVIMVAITDLIKEGILTVSEAAGRMKMNLEDFLTESGLNEKCSSDGKLMFRASTDKIIDKCMNCLVANVNPTDISFFYALINNGFFDLNTWVDE